MFSICRQTSSPAAVDQGDQSERRRYYRVRSASDIDWNYPLEGQLEPNLKGGPSESKSFDDLCMLRKQIPKLDNRTFDQIYPSDNVIRVVQKTHGVHEVKMREVADMGPQCHPLVQSIEATDDDCHMVSRLE